MKRGLYIAHKKYTYQNMVLPYTTWSELYRAVKTAKSNGYKYKLVKEAAE